MAELKDLFQTHAIVKILDFLTLYKDFEYTRTDLAEETGISRRTLYQVFPILEEFELVKMTKSSGMVRFYKLNTENPIAKLLIALADEISFHKAGKIAGVELKPTVQRDIQATSLPSTEQPIKATILLMKETIEGSPSQVENIVRGMLDFSNGETTIHTKDSTKSQFPKAEVIRNLQAP